MTRWLFIPFNAYHIFSGSHFFPFLIEGCKNKHCYSWSKCFLTIFVIDVISLSLFIFFFCRLAGCCWLLYLYYLHHQVVSYSNCLSIFSFTKQYISMCEHDSWISIELVNWKISIDEIHLRPLTLTLKAIC